jgi:hypothetical protein
METLTGKISIQEILTTNNNWLNFVAANKPRIREVVFDNINKILSCKKDLGYHFYICPHCHKTESVMHSCKSRICSSCGKKAQDLFIANTLSSILPVEYKHIVFTLPKQLRSLFLTHRRDMLSILFQTVGETLKNITLKHYGYIPGIILVPHSFGNDLKVNFHIHAIITCGGLTKNKVKWIKQKFIPEHLLKAEYKTTMLRKLRNLHQKNKFHFKHNKVKFLNYTVFNKFLDLLYNFTWYVNIGKSLKDASFAIQYVTRYTKKPVIATSRIKAFNKENNTVTFEYKDHSINGFSYTTMDALTFIGKFVMHIPERYFHQIRYYGIFANKIKTKSINHALTLMGKVLPSYKKLIYFKDRFFNAFKYDRLFCTKCNAHMIISNIVFPIKDGGP